MTKLKEVELAWLAGFIDGDGSISAQIIERKDYILGYQVRVLLTFFQLTKRHYILLYIQKLLKKGSKATSKEGTIRKRPDGMSELTIVGAKQLKDVLEHLLPYLILKKPQAVLVLQIIKKLPYTKDPYVLIEACLLADKVKLLTDGKISTLRSSQVINHLKDKGLISQNLLDFVDFGKQEV